MSSSFDIIVIGGGVVGLSAAVAMSQRNFKVAVIDGKSMEVSSKPSPRTYAINRESQIFLENLNAWSLIDKQRLAPYQKMFVWDASNQAHIDFDARTIPADRLGTIVDENNLKSALLQKAAELDISLLANNSVRSLTDSDEQILVESEYSQYTASMIIIADGALSPTRHLLNVPVTTWSYNHKAIVATIQTQKEHNNTAYQVFNTEGPLAFLPLADKHQCSIVWSLSPTTADNIMALKDAQFNQELTSAFANKLGECSVVGDRFQFPLHMRHTKNYYGNRWILMGDAAHTIHPLAGQGLNVGLADVAIWIRLLDKNKGSWSQKVLGSYQRHRKHEVWKIIALMDGLKATFANPLPPIVGLRGLGISMLNKLNPIKRLFIESANYTHWS